MVSFFFNLPHACVLLLVIWLGQDVIATSTAIAGPHRVLRAATRRGDLYKRSMRITKRFEAEVGFVEEENGWSGVSTFASQVKVGSQKPILNLEDVEHHLQDVRCSEGKMEISFVDKVSARDAYHACHEDNGGLVITSHDSCNVEGERAVYRVHDVSFTNDGEALELDVTQATWQNAFDKFDLSFGHSTDDHLFRRHSDFAKIRKRQDFNVEIPADTPDAVTTGTFNLTSEAIDKTFAAEEFLLGLEQLVPIPALPIEFGCRNCSTRGQIALNQGAIQIDLGQIDLIPDIFEGNDDGKEITSVVTGGFIELSATGVGARLELFARPKVSGAFEIALFPLPILGFAIPGIGKAGAVFEPRIAFDFEISGGFELNYGIDVTVPDNSNIRLALTNIADSGINGFPESTLTPLPFQANVTDVEILLGLAFKPTIPVGFEFANQLTAEAFVSMNLPRLDAKLSTNPAENCVNNTNNSTTPSAPYANDTTIVNPDLLALGDLTLVEANVSVTIDVGLSLQLPLLPPPFNDVGVDANLFSTVFPLVTACVDAGKALPPMTPTADYNKTMPTGKPIEGNATTVHVTATKSLVHTASASTMSKGHITMPGETASHGVATSHIVASSAAHVTMPGYSVATSHVIATSVAHVPISSAHAPAVTSVAKHTSTLVSSRHFTNTTHSASTTVTLASITLNSTSTSTLSTEAKVSSPLLSTRVDEAGQPVPTVTETPGFLNGTGGVPVRQTAPLAFTGGAVKGAEFWGMSVLVLGMSMLVGAMVL